MRLPIYRNRYPPMFQQNSKSGIKFALRPYWRTTQHLGSLNPNFGGESGYALDPNRQPPSVAFRLAGLPFCGDLLCKIANVANFHTRRASF
ncbi:hypothetical protein ACCUM_3948 [Candidatus Accumulibacter phosphatis]|uniref:Uncharacterized protein n=1 Tax=Candidatus Accumulibacter phosphatis TaxID=327160 RepID=A0A5S4EN72_9PROT|nr:hypothetical protein ACCUM_3948 [Candidatus Accumulibacter phosphatis]